MHRQTDKDPTPAYITKVFIAVSVSAMAIIGLAFLWYGLNILLIIFAGILVGIFLLDPADWLSAHSFLSRRWALIVIILAVILLLVGFSMTLASSLSSQFDQLKEVIPGSLEQFKSQLRGWPLGDALAERLEQSQTDATMLGDWFSRLSSLLSSTLGALTNVFLILVLGLFLAFEPGLYRRGFLRLFPPRRRELVSDLLETMRHKMNWWVLGRLVSMSLIGVVTGIGLWLIGVPAYLSLAVLAGLLVFIPYLGPLLAAVPILLVGLSEGLVWEVALLYLLVQGLESNLITPVIDRQSVRLPPALLLSAQVGLGLLAGIMGLLLAAPLTVLGMIIVKRVYVERWLESEG